MSAAVFDFAPPRIVDLDDRAPANLPEEFWSARPVFGQIRQAAWSRSMPADAVFGAVLIRVAFMTDHRILLPAVVGRYGSLNLMAGLVGTSSIGKGSSCDIAQELLGAPPLLGDYRSTEITAGSGEGIVRSFSELVPVEEGNKRTSEYRQVFQGVLIRVDEGEVLGQLGNRTGSTLWTVWRSGWSGEKLGFTNASRERRVPNVPAHGYRLCALVSIQPGLAGEILADEEGGTPQRFLWFNTIDPALPKERPEWPGQIRWDPPRWNWPDSGVRKIFGANRRPIEVSDAIVAELQAIQHAKVVGEIVPGIDGHRGLNQLKTAAVLAVLDQRLNVNDDDWSLASMVLDTSNAVRERTRDTVNHEHEKRDASRIEFAGRRAAAEESGRRGASATVDRVAKRVRTIVERKASDEGVARRTISEQLGGRDRDHMRTAVEVALALGWIVELNGKYYPPAAQESA